MKNNYKGIYGYYDIENEEVVYVGKDSNMGMKKRDYDHRAPCKYDAQIINKVIQNNPDRYVYYEICNLPADATTEELNHYEMMYIEKYSPRFNFTTGGDGGYEMSEEARARMSESQKAAWTHERREAMSEIWTDEMRYAAYVRGVERYGYDEKIDDVMKYYNLGLNPGEISKLTEVSADVVKRIITENDDLVEDVTRLTKVEAYECVKAGILTPKKAAALGKFENLGSFKRWYNEWLIKNGN